VCMPMCIRIVLKLICFCSLFLLQAAHVAYKVVNIIILSNNSELPCMCLARAVWVARTYWPGQCTSPNNYRSKCA